MDLLNMGSDWQTWVVYAIVAITVLVFGRNMWRGSKHGGSCGSGCGCTGTEIKRHKVVENFLKKQR